MSILEKLPDNIKKYIGEGGGSLLRGYIRFLNEGEISYICEIIESSSIWKGGTPFATTAFGDVFAWDGKYILLYKFTEADYNVILSGSTFFFDNLNDIEYQKDFFDIDLYTAAVEKYGEVDSEECYTLEPIPLLGGARELPFIHVGNMKAYLMLTIGMETTATGEENVRRV